MANTLRRIGLQITIPVIAVLIAVNAYVIVKNLHRIQQTTKNRLEAAEIQADISSVLLDLADMETGQRGYLLTGEPAYLQPYSDANARLAAHFASLRRRLPAPQERSLENLESVARSKIAEMEETIQLRERGYRHRAFVLVNSNRGKELMDEARSALTALLSAQNANVARHDGALSESVRRAYKEIALANAILLVLTVITLLAFNRYFRRLETECFQGSEQHRAMSAQLERLNSTISRDVRALVGRTWSHANALLESYGDFLPRQGQEQAEAIENGTRQMDRLLDDLFERPHPEPPAEEKEAQTAAEMTA